MFGLSFPESDDVDCCVSSKEDPLRPSDGADRMRKLFRDKFPLYHFLESQDLSLSFREVDSPSDGSTEGRGASKSSPASTSGKDCVSRIFETEASSHASPSLSVYSISTLSAPLAPPDGGNEADLSTPLSTSVFSNKPKTSTSTTSSASSIT